MKRDYLIPAVRIGGTCLERNFLASTTLSGLQPGDDPETGGSWTFGDED